MKSMVLALAATVLLAAPVFAQAPDAGAAPPPGAEAPAAGGPGAGGPPAEAPAGGGGKGGKMKAAIEACRSEVQAVDGRPDLSLIVYNPATLEDQRRIDSLVAAKPALAAE